MDVTIPVNDTSLNQLMIDGTALDFAKGNMRQYASGQFHIQYEAYKSKNYTEVNWKCIKSPKSNFLFENTYLSTRDQTTQITINSLT